MTDELKEFWRRWGEGVDVAVAAGGGLPDKLLGVRDGFLRYLHDGLSKPVSVTVTPKLEDDDAPLPFDDGEILDLARGRAAELAASLAESPGGPADEFSFVVGTESGLSWAESRAHAGSGSKKDAERRYFVRTWTVIHAFGEEAWGSSGALQLPQRLIEGREPEELPFAVPGTRRGGGMTGSLTGGLETRRRATALATFHALASLFYGVLESSPGHRRRRI